MIRKKKKVDKVPTVKQIRTAKAIAEQVRQGKNISYRRAMLSAGYAEAVANTSGEKLKKSETFRECLDRLLPQDLILGTHRKLATAKRIVRQVVSAKLSDEEVQEIVDELGGKLVTVEPPAFGRKTLVISIIDASANDNAIDKWFKVTGRYQSEAPNRETPFDGMEDEQIIAEIEKRKLDLKKSPPKPNGK